MSEVIGYKCKTCGMNVDIHGCSEHRQATDHENFEPLLNLNERGNGK